MSLEASLLVGEVVHRLESMLWREYTMIDVELFLLLIATILGAVVNALLGWSESGDAFNTRKFIPSMFRGAIAAVLVFVLSSYANLESITLMIYVLAFLAGAGVDVTGNRIAGTILPKEE